MVVLKSSRPIRVQPCVEGLEDRNLLSFAAPLSLGASTTSLVAGDFNHDGKLDLAGVSGNNVLVLLNKGGGTFQPPVSYAAGTNPNFVAVGDFNHDGKLDLAVTSDSGVSILLGKGNGTFQKAVTYAAGMNPDYVAVGDFNHDGKLDLVVANRHSGTVSVLLGKGDGTFKKAVNYAAGAVPVAIAVGDFNHDGKLDLAVADYNGGGPGKVQILMGKGDGTFKAPVAYTTSTGAQAVVAADFNGDGKTDLAVANSDGNVSVLINKGNGTFKPAVNYAAGQGSLAVGDFNHHGKLDLATINPGSGTVSVLGGNGDGTFQAAVATPVGGSPTAVVAGDFNNDHLPDLAVAGTGVGDALLLNAPTASHLSVSAPATVTAGNPFTFTITARDALGNVATGYLGTVRITTSDVSATLPAQYTFTAADHGSHTFTATGVLWTVGPQTITATDQGASGMTAQANVKVVVPTSPPSSALSLTAPTYNVVGLKPVAMVTGDFNGDGKTDVVTANIGDLQHPGTGSLSFLAGNGNGTFQTAVTIPLGGTSTPISLAAGDFNGDGKLDLAVANLLDGTVSVLFGNGDGTFTAGPTLQVGPEPFAVVAADLNHDGKIDLAVTSDGNLQSPTTPTLTVFRGNGDGTFQQPQTYAVGDQPVALTAADLSGSGKLDLAVVSRTAGTVTLLHNNGSGLYETPVSFNAGTEPISVQAGDLNGDGKADLVVANATSSTVSVLMNQGGGTFQTAVNYPVNEDPEAVALGDFNGDGKLDIAVTANYDKPTGTVSVLLNKGNGTFNTPIDYAVGAGPVPVAAVDLNGDGTTDLVVGNAGSTQTPAASVAVLLNQGPAQLQFSAASYQVKQNAGPAVITVTRTGDLSKTVTVHYSAGGGSSVPGVNYTPVSGTITFHSGEVAKTFTVSVANDALVEGDETVNLTLSSPTGGATLAGGAAQAVLTIQDTNGTANQRFVAQLYQDLLQRPPDAPALTGWSGQLDLGLLTHTQVAQAILNTDEYRTLVVQGLYQTYLGRSADPDGLHDLVHFLRSGGTREQVIAGLVSSPEYFARAGGSNAGFLTALYRDLFGRPIDPDGAAGWGSLLNQGWSRATVANALMGSLEAKEVIVAGFYQRFLHRAAEGNALTSFATALSHGMRDEQLIALLVGSPEYAANL
jgi:hypothetical protein